MKVALDGRARAYVRQHNLTAWGIWHGASLQRTPKRLPPLRKFMIQHRDRAPQSPQQMLAIAKMWAQLGGGKIKSSKA